MHEAALKEWLLGDEPEPTPAVRSSLATASLPPGLAERTLSQVDEEWGIRPRRAPRRIWAGVGLALAASALMWIQAPGLEEPKNTDHMVAKGLEATAPSLSLKMAVKQGETISRHAVGTQYSKGDTLFFRAHLSDPGWVYLVHAADSVEVVATQFMEAGQSDLGESHSVHAWSLDASDSQGFFALVGHKEPLSSLALVETLSGDPAHLCQRARGQGWSCDARMVEVAP